MQPSFMVAKLVLQTERLVSSSGYVGFTLQFTPTVIISEPNQVAVFAWDTDLVAVEVVGLLSVFAVFVDMALIGVIAYICATHSMSGLKVLCRLRLVYVGNGGFIRDTNY